MLDQHVLAGTVITIGQHRTQVMVKAADVLPSLGTHGTLWLAALIGAIVGGVFSALVTRRSAYKPRITGTNSDANEPPN